MTDAELLAAALLHDTIEDTATTEEELRTAFGARIAGIVCEVTDDKRLSKAERKRIQLDNACAREQGSPAAQDRGQALQPARDPVEPAGGLAAVSQVPVFRLGQGGRGPGPRVESRGSRRSSTWPTRSGHSSRPIMSPWETTTNRWCLGPDADGPPRNVPLILLAVFATVFVLDWAQPVLVPLVLGLMMSYALGPVVDRLAEAFHPPRRVRRGAACSPSSAAWARRSSRCRTRRCSLAETLPEAVQKFQRAAREEFGGSEHDAREGAEGRGRTGARDRRARAARAARRHARADRAAEARHPQVPVDHREQQLGGHRRDADRDFHRLFPARVGRCVSPQVGQAVRPDAEPQAGDRPGHGRDRATRSSATSACRC